MISSTVSSRLYNPSNTRTVSGGEQADAKFMYLLQQAISSAEQNIGDVYNEKLGRRRFQGGWKYKPDYTDADYESYAVLLDAAEQPFQEEFVVYRGGYFTREALGKEALEKYALIGTNKLWATLAYVTSRVETALYGHMPENGESDDDPVYSLVERSHIETAELTGPHGLIARTTPETDQRSGYDYKNLFIADPLSNLSIMLRAADAVDFEYLDQTGDPREQVAKRLLETYRRFHSAILEGNVELAVTYSLER